MRNRIKAAIISTISIESDIMIVRRESKSDLEKAMRRVQFEKCYHKNEPLLTQFEMGFMRQLDMFKQQRRLSVV
jgi:hypothetical protein